MSLSSPYDVLVPWCKLDEHAKQSDEERYIDLNTKSITRVFSRFGSYRTLASILTPQEYSIVKQSLSDASKDNPLVADSVAMLGLPGDAAGNGGGIDFGNYAVRALCDMILSAEIATKIKSLAEENISQVESWGVDIGPGQLASARQLIEEGK